jgi:hypothetical protein
LLSLIVVPLGKFEQSLPIVALRVGGSAAIRRQVSQEFADMRIFNFLSASLGAWHARENL